MPLRVSVVVESWDVAVSCAAVLWPVSDSSKNEYVEPVGMGLVRCACSAADGQAAESEDRWAMA